MYGDVLLLGVSGYVSSNFYRNIGGTNWVWNVVLTTSIFSGIIFAYLFCEPSTVDEVYLIIISCK